MGDWEILEGQCYNTSTLWKRREGKKRKKVLEWWKKSLWAQTSTVINGIPAQRS